MLLVLMCLEKCFVIYFPLKSKTVCTVKTAKWGTCVVGVILAGYDLQYLIVCEATVDDNGCVCKVTYLNIMGLVDSYIYSIGPFILMFITNLTLCSNSLQPNVKVKKVISQNPPIRLLLNLPPGRQLWLSLFLLHFYFSQDQMPCMVFYTDGIYLVVSHCTEHT